MALFCDERHEEPAREVHSKVNTIKVIRVPWSSISDIETTSSECDEEPEASWHSKDIAYYHHSSGSSGLPKLIPYTHNDAVGVLPRLQPLPHAARRSRSLLTTTPFYHGGLPELWRVWSTAGIIWLFPEDKVPITGGTMCQWFNAIEKYQGTRYGVAMNLFACVPYVLQIIANDVRTRAKLKAFEIVGVGGAEMPFKLGDELVDESIRLVSRFGSAECGFLMCSDRDYERDKNWQYLRCRSDMMRFEHVGGDEFEMVVTEDWPLTSSAITDKLPFHTSDLFARHPTIDKAWKYLGRSDSRITLVTGNKFNPSSMESALSGSRLITEAIVVGDRKPYPGVFVFLSEDAKYGTDSTESEIWDLIDGVNNNFASYARLRRDMIKIFSHEDVAKVSKSSKGTVKRVAFLTDFHDEIEDLYRECRRENGSPTTDVTGLDLEEVMQAVQTIVHHQTHKDLTLDASLFDAGIDSITSLRIREHLSSMVPTKIQLPLSMVYDCNSIRSLSEQIHRLCTATTSSTPTKTSHEDMESMVKSYYDRRNKGLKQGIDLQVETSPMTVAEEKQEGEVVLLTGATGFLGAHIVNQLLDLPAISSIVLLVRPCSQTTCNAAEHRVAKVLESLGLRNLHSNNKIHVQCHEVDMQSPLCGWSPETWARLARTVTTIIHAAWPVKFDLPLKAFGGQMQTLLNLYSLVQSFKREVNFCFCSSIASVGSSSATTIKETLSSKPEDAGHLGYSQSKWVAENLLHKLASPSKQRISIIRIGQLCGDTKYGVWNMKEAWPSMIHAAWNSFHSSEANCDRVAMFPNLANQPPLSWLPVDIAAKGIIDIALRTQVDSEETTRVYHLVSQADHPTWDEVLVYLQENKGAGGDLSGKARVIAAKEWLDILERSNHPAKSLVPLWRKNWTEGNTADNIVPKFRTANAEEVCEALRELKGVDYEQLMKMVSWIVEAKVDMNNYCFG